MCQFPLSSRLLKCLFNYIPFPPYLDFIMEKNIIVPGSANFIN